MFLHFLHLTCFLMVFHGHPPGHILCDSGATNGETLAPRDTHSTKGHLIRKFDHKFIRETRVYFIFSTSNLEHQIDITKVQ